MRTSAILTQMFMNYTKAIRKWQLSATKDIVNCIKLRFSEQFPELINLQKEKYSWIRIGMLLLLIYF